MRFLFVLSLAVPLAAGCSKQSPGPGPQPAHEWFVLVAPGLPEALHERFADELPTFAERFAKPGEVMHVVASPGYVSFTVTVPENNQLAGTLAGRELTAAGRFFLYSTHLEGCDECRLDLDMAEFEMEQLRATDLPTRVILLGSRRPNWFVDFGCECENAPHSLLNEFFARRFHPEFKVRTRSDLDFKQKYGF